jgi:hypothetical protein
MFLNNDCVVPEGWLGQLVALEGESGLGPFDAGLLSGKAREAGYVLACCGDLFVHHFGSHTFAHGAPIEEAKP